MSDLTFSLGGDISVFERAMNLAKTTAIKSANEMIGTFQKASQSIDAAFKGIQVAKVAVGALVGFEALKFAINTVTEAAAKAEEQLAGLVDIASKAGTAGVGTTFFQSFTKQAKDLNVETSDLVSMLNQAREASTTKIGEGNTSSTSTGQDRIQQNVLAGNLPASAGAQFADAQGQEDRIKVVLGLLDQLKAKGANLAAFDLANTFFGATFEQKLRDGVDIVGKMRTALDGLTSAGGERIIPQSEIDNAVRINAEIAAINDKIANGLRPMQDDIARWQAEQLDSTVLLKGYWADIVVTFGQLWSWCDQIGATIQTWANGPQWIKDFNSTMDRWGLMDHSLIDALAKNDTSTAVALPTITVRPKQDTSKTLPPLHPAAASGGGSQTDQVDTYINSLKKQTAAEQAEAATLGLGNKAKAEAVDLAKAQQAASERGTPLTAAETAEVKNQADAYVAAKQQIDNYAKAQENAAETAKFFGSTVESAIEKAIQPGARLQDVLLGIVQSLEQAALKALILGEGPLASLFGTAPAAGAKGAASVGGLFGLFSGGVGSLFGGSIASNYATSAASAAPGMFGPGFAGGGAIRGPGTGTSDSIPIAASHGEFMVNAAATRSNLPLLQAINSGKLRRFAGGGLVMSGMPSASASSGGGSPVNITHAPVINAMQAPGVTPDHLARVLDQNNKQFARNIGPIVADAQRRYAGR